jgi:putative membrane protein
MYFNEAQTTRLDALASRIQQRSGVRLKVVVVDRSGNYPEVAWKAFAFGVCAHALIHLMQAVLHQDRMIVWSIQNTIGFIIGTSAGIALLTQYWPPFGTVFLDRSHAEKTARNCAESLFVKHEIYNAPARNGILMLVSLLERQVIVLPDSRIAGHFDVHAQQQVISAMFPLLRRQDYYTAVEKGLKTMQALLPATELEPLLQDDVLIEEAFVQLKGADV